MSTIVYDIEVAFLPEITELAIERGLDEKKFSAGRFGPTIDANSHYVCHISYKIDNHKVVDLSLLDGKGSLRGDVNEKQLLKAFAKAHDYCQESVAHYGAKFDLPFLNARYQRQGLPRLKPIKLQDTWRILKSNFLLVNNRLDSAIKFFGCPYGKPSLIWNVWREVSLGVRKAHTVLRHRCRYDVLSLAWLWKNVFSKFANRANQALKYDRPNLDKVKIAHQVAKARCPKCEAKGYMKQEGWRDSSVESCKQLSCRKCFLWSHAPLVMGTKKKKGTAQLFILGRIR